MNAIMLLRMNCHIFKERCFSWFYFFLLLNFWSISWLACSISCYDMFFFFLREFTWPIYALENTFTIKLFESNHFNNLQKNYGHIGWFNVNIFLDALCSRYSRIGLGWIYAQLVINPTRSGGEILGLPPIGKGN